MTEIDECEVFHVITESTWGGAQRIVKLLCEGTSPKTQVACAPGGQLVDELDQIGVPVHPQPDLVSPPAIESDPRALWDLLWTIREIDPDIVHCHSTKAGIIGRLAAAATSTPTVFTVHGWGFYNTEYQTVKPLIVGLERALARITTRHICVSNHDLQQGLERSILSEPSATVIRNGIPAPLIDTKHTNLRKELGIGREQVIIGAVARLVEQKAPERILRLGARLREAGYDVATVLIGDGPRRDSCEQLASDDPNMHVLGFREDALQCMAAFDIFALPSRFEGLPLTVLEAMYLGVPVVGYNVGGVSEAIEDRKTGFLVPPGAFERLYRATRELVRDEDERRSLSDGARARAKEQFTAARMTQEYDQLYESVLDAA